MTPLIRRAKVEDACAIARIGRRSFHDAFAHLFCKQEELETYLDHTYDPLHIQKSILKPNNVYFLALMNDTAVGFAKMKKVSYHKEVIALDQSELQKIYVLKEFHGSGVGQGLLDAVIQQTQELETDQLWLDVHVSNEKARRFYQKNGFKKAGNYTFTIGTQVFYYYVMSLPITIQLSKIKEYGSS